MSGPRALTDESTSRRLLEEALRLPEVDRLHLAAELLASVHGPDERTDAEWLEELRHRADRVRRGESKGRPWSAVRAELLADLNR